MIIQSLYFGSYAGLILSIIAWVMMSCTAWQCSMNQAEGQMEAEGQEVTMKGVRKEATSKYVLSAIIEEISANNNFRK